MSGIITLTTDFGRDGWYVAAMKGVILSVNAHATIVDISHSIAPQNIAEGAFVLGEASRWFPPGTIHAAVVDPGVGTDRRILYARVGDQHYVCPDNGLLSYTCRDCRPDETFEVTNRATFAPKVSSTFHGRDIMAPVAARLSLGLSPRELGPPVNDLKLLSWPRPERREKEVIARILCADVFGNLITNLRREDLPRDIEPAYFFVEAGEHKFDGIVNTYLEAPPGTPVALFGSSGLLELAIVQGNAALELQIAIGDNVGVRW
jgi:S-adenosyl-L-methionine hydrolase (adenosine-forming)